MTLWEETEWVETAEASWNVLVGCDPDRIRQAALVAHSSTPFAPPPPCTFGSWPYGDGHAAERIVQLINHGVLR